MNLNRKAQSLYKLQSYEKAPPIEGVALHKLRRFHDDGGSLTELLRFEGAAAIGIDDFRPAQLNYSCVQPGAIKAFHVHRQQTDLWFVPPEDRILAILVDLREGSPTESNRLRMVLGDGESSLLRIPPGVAHGCRNIGGDVARLLYVTNLHFSAEHDACDEGRLPWDFVGKESWEISIE